MENNIKVEVAYAAPEQQTILHLSLPANSSIYDALLQTKLSLGSPDKLTVGIFGKLRNISSILQDGDRVEIYRPLLLDPKELRIQRAKREHKNKKS